MSSGAARRSRSRICNKVYGNGSAALVALDDINLRVAPGEFLCIVGPSGCGKSTLLRILAGLDQQTSGRIDVDAAGWAVQNAMVFQDSGLFPWMRVEKQCRLRPDHPRRAGGRAGGARSRPRSSWSA